MWLYLDITSLKRSWLKLKQAGWVTVQSECCPYKRVIWAHRGKYIWGCDGKIGQVIERGIRRNQSYWHWTLGLPNPPNAERMYLCGVSYSICGTAVVILANWPNVLTSHPLGATSVQRKYVSLVSPDWNDNNWEVRRWPWRENSLSCRFVSIWNRLVWPKEP